VVLDSVSAQLGTPIPPPGIPGPFALEDADRLAAILTDAALVDVVVAELSVPLKIDSFDAWWARTTALAGPLARMLESMHEDGQQELRARARAAAQPYETPQGLEFPGVTLIASARRL
jgi:hypothetical protein